MNNRCLAGLHLGELFLLIIGQADSVLAHSIIALKRLLKLGLGAGLLRGQLRKLVFALCSLALDGRQLAIELSNFGFLDCCLLQHLAGWSHRNAHFIDRHVLDQLERQHTNQWQPDHQHEAFLQALT